MFFSLILSIFLAFFSGVFLKAFDVDFFYESFKIVILLRDAR